ncbi:DUF2018 family protein [Helicobacter sp. MIT 05-5293]|uniref:DUF2018 domain-containing protein n=1 Tax=uncultured Helicobacter sp. TaxID=175537 RepID=A0A650ELC2_9HELI|nr:DUF2018 family protein [Helicobacter sp. MIT 05-5293]QGT50366.1 hypothetical protein Helico5904_0380 [uncultured Helicobacter sp.]TLD82208.1 DUF2018 family protein [Helicobacter sp. MIT 05-5293]
MDIFFEGTPIDKWKEVILNASPTLVGMELEHLIERLVTYEILLEQNDIETEEAFQRYYYNPDNKPYIEERKNNIAIESMGKILGQYE